MYKAKLAKIKTLEPASTLQIVKALVAYEKQEAAKKAAANTKTALFDNEFTVSLVFGTKKIPERGSNKPIPIELPHSLYNHDGVEICLFVKDPASDAQKLLEENPVAHVTEIIGLTKLRKNYHQFEDKRTLCQKYQLFLADDRITPMLPPLLGKYFFERKKQPLSIHLGKNSFRQVIETARDSTAMFISAGSSFMIKIGTHRLSAAQIAENICTALPEILTHVPGAWKNIDSIGIKTATSLTLPLYNAVEPSPLVASESIKGQFVDASAKPTKAAATPKAAAAKTSATPKTETKSAAKTEVKSAVKTETKKGKQSKKAVADVEMDEASFEQMLQESGLEVPADEQDEELEDGSDVEEEEVVQPKSTKGAAVAKSSLITAAKAARDDIAARPKSKVAAAKAKSKTASKK